MYSAAASGWLPARTSPIAVESAKFALTEVRLGIVPAAISPYVVAAIGAREARRLFLTSAPFDGRGRRDRSGSCISPAPSDELDAVGCNRQIELILQGGPHALRAAKQLIRDVGPPQDRDRLGEHTARLLASLRISPEGQEGLVGIPRTPQGEMDQANSACE